MTFNENKIYIFIGFGTLVFLYGIYLFRKPEASKFTPAYTKKLMGPENLKFFNKWIVAPIHLLAGVIIIVVGVTRM